MLRAAFFALPAFGAIRGALLGGGQSIIKDEIDLQILKHVMVIIQPEIMRNIHTLRARQTIGTGGAVDGQHFLLGFRHPINQGQIFGGQGIGAALAGDFQIFPELGHGIHAA